MSSLQLENSLQVDAAKLDATKLDAFHAALDSLVLCYESHKQSLLRKREVLIKSLASKESMTELQATDRALLSLNQRAKQIDRNRHRIQIEMGCGDFNLSQLIDTIQDSFRAMARKLSILRDRLQCALRESSQLNSEIKELLELSLGWVRETVEIITTAYSPEGSSYGVYATKPTKQESSPPTGLRSTVSHSV
jgi:hypothetical protein